jgi:hypothetical protein
MLLLTSSEGVTAASYPVVELINTVERKYWEFWIYLLSLGSSHAADS